MAESTGEPVSEQKIREILADIDNYRDTVSNKRLRNLKFLALEFKPSGNMEEATTVPQVYDLIASDYSLHGKVSLMIKLLSSAKFSDDVVKPLYDLLQNCQVPANKENIPNVSDRVELVKFAHELDDNPKFREIVNNVERDYIKTAHENIETGLDLVERAIFCDHLQVHKEDSRQSFMTKIRKIEQLVSSAPSEDNDRITITSKEQPSAPLVNREKPLHENCHQCADKCTLSFKICCAGILITLGLLLVGTIILVILAVLYGSVLAKEDLHQTTIHEGNVTFQALGTCIDSQFYDQATFDLLRLSSNTLHAVSFHICQLNSDSVNHITTTLTYTETISKRLALLHFKDVTDFNDAVEASKYMLVHSNVSVFLERLDLPPNTSATLFIHKDAETCDRHLDNATYRSQVKKLTFSRENQTLSFTVSTESYICGVWALPEGGKLDYHVTATVYSYDISSCERSHNCTIESTNGSCDVSIERNHLQSKKREVCFLLTRQDSSVADVRITSSVRRTQNNAGFIVSFITYGIYVIAVVLFIELVCCICHWHCSRGECTHASSV